MSSAEGVVLALCTLGEAGHAAGLAEGGHLWATAGEDLVGISLVTDVPDEAVVGGVEYVMQSDGELDDAKGSTEMTAGV